MNFTSRAIMAGIAASAIFSVCAVGNAREAYPTQPVRILVGYQAGGPTDVVARMVAAGLQQELGQPFIVDNRPGVGGNIAAEAVALAKPDGYTLLVTAATFTMNGNVYKDQKYDPIESFVPISKITIAPSILVVNNDSPAKSLSEFIAHGKEPGRELMYGSPGVGGTQHMSTERLVRLTDISARHIPYKGGAGVITDLIAGHIDFGLVTSTGSLAQIKSNRVRPLAVTGDQRISDLPDVPTFAELGLEGMPSDAWNGILAPRNTPKEIVDVLSQALKKVTTSHEMQSKMQPLGAVVVGNDPQDFSKEIKEEVERWKSEFQLVDVNK